MWLYEGKEVTDISIMPESIQGFIYKITNLKTGKFYIGKKSIVSNTKKKLTQKELAAWSKPGKRPTHVRVTKESDWQKYWVKKMVMEGLSPYVGTKFEFPQLVGGSSTPVTTAPKASNKSAIIGAVIGGVLLFLFILVLLFS